MTLIVAAYLIIWLPLVFAGRRLGSPGGTLTRGSGFPRSWGCSGSSSSPRAATRPCNRSGRDMPLADWLILAALAVVILFAIRYARHHPKVPPR